MTLILSADDLAGLVPLPEAISAVRAVHAELAAGQAYQPAPIALGSSVSTSVLLPMVASSGRLNLSVVKALTDAPDNRGRGLPTQRSVVLVLDSTTGECLAVIDGAVVTRARTAAATAVATDALANPDASTLGLVGAGRLAIEHVAAIRAVRPISRIHVWSRSADTLAAFRSRGRRRPRHQSWSPVPRTSSQPPTSCCTLTPSRTPIVSGAWFHPGLHLNAVGAPPRADHREIDAAGMAAAKVFVDSTATQLAKSGDALLSIADGTTTEADFQRELGSVLIGRGPRPNPPRRHHVVQLRRARAAGPRLRGAVSGEGRQARTWADRPTVGLRCACGDRLTGSRTPPPPPRQQSERRLHHEIADRLPV